MNRTVIIIVGVLIFLLAIFLIWRFVIPRFERDGQDTRQVASEEIAEVFENPIVPSDESILGQTVLIQENEVKIVFSKNSFWMGPKGADGNIIVVREGHGLGVNNIVNVTGTVKLISDFNEDVNGWNITDSILSQIDLSPYFIDASQIQKQN